MAAWNLYFISKLVLHAFGRLRLSPILDALLLALVLAPLPERWRRPRAAAAWAAAVALAWSESWLPPPATIWHFLADPSTRPSFGYVLRFLGGAVSLPLLAAFAALAGAVVWTARRGFRLTPLVVAGLIAAAIADPSALSLSGASRERDAFYASEARRLVRLGPAAEPAFDVIILHVCSLSWDDLRTAGLEGDPFWRGFQAAFSRFNSATSYSNPSAIRLLRAPCGQRGHAGIFQPAADACYLLDGLRRLGYRSWAASNHDGSYDHYAETLKAHARADDPMPLDGVPVAKLNFNESAIFDDWAVLNRWWRERQRSGAPRAALYYNSVSLHQGAHARGQPGDWSKGRVSRYRDSARAFFAEMDRFFSLIQASGRRAVVLFVSEHGAALAGSAVQAPDLRDIPTPALTLVPVGVRILGPGAPISARAASDRPVSYLALAELLRRFLERPPFANGSPSLEESLRGLPETALVSENENARVLESWGRFLVQEKSGRWKRLP